MGWGVSAYIVLKRRLMDKVFRRVRLYEECREKADGKIVPESLVAYPPVFAWCELRSRSACLAAARGSDMIRGI